MFEAAAFEVVFELTLDVVGQGRALRDHPAGEHGGVRIDELVEECGLRIVAFVGRLSLAFFPPDASVSF